VLRADALGLSWLNVDAARLDAAFKEAEEKVKKHPEDPEARCRLGICQLKRGQFEAAIPEFEKAAALAPQAPGPLYLHSLAVALGRSWLSPLMVQLAEKALHLHPQMKEAQSLLHVYKGRERLDAAQRPADYEAALQDFRQALALKVAEQMPHIYYFSGQAFDGAEDAENAIKMYQEACQLGLVDTKVLIRLGVLLAQTGQHQLAVWELEKAEELDPTNDSVQQLLAATRAKLAKKRA
jgi:tetratricopeptide (TPR) repeat protein